MSHDPSIRHHPRQMQMLTSHLSHCNICIAHGLVFSVKCETVAVMRSSTFEIFTDGKLALSHLLSCYGVILINEFLL